MANYKSFLKSGHPPTLFAAFLYFDFSFAVWVLNGAMGPFISEAFHLSPAQIGLMVSVPTLAGAFMRFPLGVLSQYIGRKNAAIVEMSAIMIACCTAFSSFNFQQRAGHGRSAGHCGSQLWRGALARLRMVPQAIQGAGHGHCRRGQQRHGRSSPLCSTPGDALWLAACVWLRRGHDAAAAVRHDFLRQGAARHRASSPHASTSDAFLKRTAGISISIYIITFGGFIGLATFLPSFYYTQFHVTKIRPANSPFWPR